jgi:hypothetical protein
MKDTRPPFDVPTFDEAARRDYDAGKLDARGVAKYLAHCTGFPWTCAEALAYIKRDPRPGENLWPGCAFCRG